MDKYEKRRQRLIELRDGLCDGSGAELARKIGKSDSYVARMFYPTDKKGFKRIGEDTVDAIDSAFEWPAGSFDSEAPISELAHGLQSIDAAIKSHKPVLIASTKHQQEGSLHDRNVEPGPEIRGKLPLISWVQAGTWESVVNNFEVGDAEEWIAAPMLTSKSAYYLRVRGESMYNPDGEPSFRENDLILVEPQSHADHNSLVVVVLDDEAEATFKQLIVEGGKQYLKALNPSWPNRIIEVNGNATICGVVKSKIVRY